MKRPQLFAPLLVAFATGFMPLADAMEAIPTTAGWRGFAVAGAGYAGLRSNFITGNRAVDLGDPVISSLDTRPSSESAVYPVITGEVNYTFASGWQGFLGLSLEDAVTLDPVSQLGARKDFGKSGAVQAGVLVGVPLTTWEDPYAEGVARTETDRDSTGLRLQWDRVLGTAFELTLTFRDIAIDQERSGQDVLSVSCDLACQQQLRRDGGHYTFDVAYLYRLGAGQNHLLRPLVRYISDDRDGDAIAGDGYRLQLTYVYMGQGWVLTSNVAYGANSQDARNPIFAAKTDSDRFALDTTLLYRLPVASGRWQAVANLLWGEDDSEVDFHDHELFVATVGALYRFGAR
jgi:Protein of unknown function (DUF2860)